MDTGGGERFLSLREFWPKKVVATEEYLPNFKLATERLIPYGAQVFQVNLNENEVMPFGDGEFDVVLNRHSPFNSSEVARILASGGSFLTQQVHGLWAQDLFAAFDTSPQWPFATPERYIPRLETAGLKIVNAQEWSGHFSFSDVGALVYYLKAVPWIVPNFSVESHLRYLLALQQRLERGEDLVFQIGYT